MIDVALLGIIRRWHLRDQISLREIAKRLGISRNTVRRHLRSETVEPAYADRRSASALDAYAFKLSTWLKTESTKSRKQKRSLKQMHADLRLLGFDGSYDRVAAFARQWKLDQLDRVSSASKGTDAVLGFLHFGFGKTDDGEGRQAIGQMHLHRHRWGGHAGQGAAAQDCQAHRNAPGSLSAGRREGGEKEKSVRARIMESVFAEPQARQHALPAPPGGHGSWPVPGPGRRIPRA